MSTKLYWTATKGYSLGELPGDAQAVPPENWQVTFRVPTTILVEFGGDRIADVQVVARGRVEVVGIAPG